MSALSRIEDEMLASATQFQPAAPAVELAREPDPRWYPALLYLYVIAAVPYLAWRLTVVNWSVWFGPVLALLELYSIVVTFLFLLISQKVFRPVPRPAPAWRSVDVLITTFGEPLSVLRPTVEAALMVRGVSSVLVLDDARRGDVATMASQLGARYYARTTNEHAKAGNLNHGLLHSDAEFLMILDADHVPLPHFLERTLGYFDDPELAFVQSPQSYYNQETFLYRRSVTGVWSEQGMFYGAVQPSKNGWNAPFFVGTSALLRRSALDSVGGFATGTATEDIHTSLRLHARGWKSLFVPEPLAYGLEAENLKEYYSQRRRWAAGSLGLLIRSPDSPLRARGLSLGQRLNYLSATLAHLQGAQKLFFFLIPIICLFTLQSPVITTGPIVLIGLAGFAGVSILVTTAYARGTYHPIYTESYNLSNFMASLVGLWGVVKVQKKFRVSRKNPPRHERHWLSTLMWGLLLLDVAAAGRGLLLTAGLVGHGLSGRLALIAVSTGLATFNLVVLGTFVVHLTRYQRRPHRIPQPDVAIPLIEMRRRRKERWARADGSAAKQGFSGTVVNAAGTHL